MRTYLLEVEKDQQGKVIIFKELDTSTFIAIHKNGQWWYKDQGYQNQLTPVKDINQFLNPKEQQALAKLLNPLDLK